MVVNDKLRSMIGNALILQMFDLTVIKCGPGMHIIVQGIYTLAIEAVVFRNLMCDNSDNLVAHLCTLSA